ncbi:MAG: hypothetical protein K2X77_24795 [Candidatus Obscuribacterales bacterium]|jgi:hypothetical protein|nr:hypothetical protein [Candidatus Obscuribacterales bacterium]
MKKKLTVAAPYLLTLLAVWLLWPAAATIEWIKGTAPPEWRVTQAEQWMVFKILISGGLLLSLIKQIVLLKRTDD